MFGAKIDGLEVDCALLYMSYPTLKLVVRRRRNHVFYLENLFPGQG